MNETWMWQTFGYGATVTDVKVIRDKATGKVAGYGFVEFQSTFEAEQVLVGYQGKPIANHPAGKMFKLNWGTQGLSGSRRDGIIQQPVAGVGANASSSTPGMPPVDFPIFVGDLAHDVNDHMLMRAFYPRYPSVTSAKVVMDKSTNKSRGYGFVRFSNLHDQMLALNEMNGAWISTRQIRCGEAHNSSSGSARQLAAGDSGEPKTVGAEDEVHAVVGAPTSEDPAYITHATIIKPEDRDAQMDPANTTLFVGGLDPHVTEVVLCTTFAVFGTITYCRVPPGRACGFIQFDSRQAAEHAMQTMNNTFLMGGKIRVNWGKAGVRKGSIPIAPGFSNPPATAAGVGPGGVIVSCDNGQDVHAHAHADDQYGGWAAGHGGNHGQWGSWSWQRPTAEGFLLDAPMTYAEVTDANDAYVAARAGRLQHTALARVAHGCGWGSWTLQQGMGADGNVDDPYALVAWDCVGACVP
jgi:RNA recognition motif-containing protein